MPKPKLTDYEFPAPPVYSGAWTDRDWLRYARHHGRIARKGPMPSVKLYNGLCAPFAGEYNAKGEPLYACDQAFRPVFRNK